MPSQTFNHQVSPPLDNWFPGLLHIPKVNERSILRTTLLLCSFIKVTASQMKSTDRNVYCNESNYLNHPIIWRKNDVFTHPHMKSNIRTPTPWGARTGVAEHLLAFDSLCGARTGVAKCVITFDSLCGAWTGVAKRVLAFNCLCRAQTGVAKRVIPFDSLCGAQTGVRERLLAFDSLWTSLVIVTSNVHVVFVWIVLL